MREVVDALLSTGLAASCGVCSRVLEHPTGGAICPACWKACRRFTPPVCSRCGLPTDRFQVSGAGCPGGREIVPEADPLCARCRRSPGVIALARAIGPHEGTLREIVHALKYQGLTSIAAPLAAAMRAGGLEVLTGADAVVPVPLHPRREWQRGFNQAEALAAHLGLPVRRVLCRRRPTRPQASLRAGDRRRNVDDAFRLAALPRVRGLAAWANVLGRLPTARTEREIAGRILVLVDDVSTTGATLEACARVLVQKGAREVRALTAARAVLARR